MTLPELAIRRPITTSVILVSILVIGFIALSRLPLAFMPDFEERQVFVIVDYPNASPKTIERMVIRPLEEEMSSLEGLQFMWSRCDADGGRVSLNFGYDSDMGVLRAEIRERVDRARENMPEDVERIRLATNWDPQISGDTIIESRLSSGRDLSRDYDLLERKIIKPLERVNGVASVNLDGVNPREVKVNLKLNALKRHNVDPSQIVNLLYNNNVDRSLGLVRNDSSYFTLRTTGAFRELEDISELPIPGTNLRLHDVAEITYKEPPLEYGRHLDGQFAVGVSISQESAANTVQVSQDVHEKIESMRADPELEGINFLVWSDQGKEILKTIDDLKQTGLIGGILASLILFIFLRRFSTTFIAVASIPFSLVVACGVIWARGQTLNTITMLGLIVGIGMLVDNAVVIMENIDRYQKKGVKAKVAALIGAREVSIAVIAATLTSIIVFLPVFFSKPNQMNLILKELSLTISITLLASLFISQTLIPLCAGYFTKSKVRGRARFMAWMTDKYRGILGFTLRHRWSGLLIGLLVSGSAVIPFTRMGINFETTNTEMFVGMFYRFSEDVPLETKEAMCTQVEEALAPYKEEWHVDSIYSWWARNVAITRLYMKEGHATVEDMNAIRKKLPDILPKIPGVKIAVNDGGSFWQRNSGRKIAFQLQGPDTEVLADLSEQAKSYFYEVEGLFDVYSDAEGGASELHARIDRDRARAFGVDLNTPERTVEYTFRGRRLQRFKDPKGEVEMRLTLDEKEDESIDQLKSLPIQQTSGSVVPFETFADFSVVKGPDRINRNNKITSVWVGARYEEGEKDVYRDIMIEKLKNMSLPYGYRWDFQAGLERSQESQQEFLVNLLLALLLIFAVMAGLFESITQAIGLLFSLPLAIAGAGWALYLSGTDLDQPAAIGLLLLLGIVVNNGIVMVEHINSYRRQGMERSKAMILGGGERLRPIVITALTTLFGLVPMIVQKPSLSGVYYYSMAYVITGGLLVSSIFTTLLLPAFVCMLEDCIAFFARLFGRKPKTQTLEPALQA